MSNDDIILLLDKMDKRVKAIKTELLQQCWGMRGSLSLDQAMMLSPADRNLITTILNNNLETTKKLGLPYF